MAGAGGIANGGTATITASQVTGNTAPGAGGRRHPQPRRDDPQRQHGHRQRRPRRQLGDQGSGGGIAN